MRSLTYSEEIPYAIYSIQDTPFIQTFLLYFTLIVIKAEFYFDANEIYPFGVNASASIIQQ